MAGRETGGEEVNQEEGRQKVGQGGVSLGGGSQVGDVGRGGPDGDLSPQTLSFVGQGQTQLHAHHMMSAGTIVPVSQPGPTRLIE